jgi:hypothetical protein
MTELLTDEQFLNFMKNDNLIIILDLEYCSFSKYFHDNIKNINLKNIGIISKKINKKIFNEMILYSTPKFILTINKIGYELYPHNIDHLNKLIKKYIK